MTAAEIKAAVAAMQTKRPARQIEDVRKVDGGWMHRYSQAVWNSKDAAETDLRFCREHDAATFC